MSEGIAGRPPRWAWAAFWVACLAGVAFAKEVTRRERAAAQAFETAERAEILTARIRRDLARELWRTDPPDGRKRWTLAEVEREINGGEPFKTLPLRTKDGASRRRAFIASPAGAAFYLDFENGEWCELNPYPFSNSPLRTHPRSPLYASIRQACDAAARISGWGWAGLFVLTVPLMRSRFGPALARASLVAAILFMAASEAESSEWARHEMLCGGAAMVGLSFTFVGIGRVNESLRREDRVSRRECVACGYDLRASFDRCPECGTSVPVRERRAGQAMRDV